MDLKQLRAYQPKPADLEDYRTRLFWLVEIDSRNASIDHKQYLLEVFHTESETFDQTKEPASNLNDRQNLGDMGGFQPYSSSAGRTQDSNNDLNTVYDPKKFFSRPIEIASFSVAPPNIVAARYRVWDLYTVDPSVRAKFRNYSYAKFTLNVRVAISGTPFHSGRVLISYQPYAAYNTALLNALNVGNISLVHQVDAAFLSQAPGAVTVDIKANQPVDLKLPFICPANMARLFNSSSPIGASTPFNDFLEMGTLYIHSLGPLSAIGANITPINFNIYAWAEDVELGAPTNTIMAIQTESELKTGPIANVATNALKVFDFVKPILPPWALPSRMILSGIRDVSVALGWSRPPSKVEYTMVKNVGFSNTANTIGWDTSQRLTMDPQQELTVDPRICGRETDDMIIANISSREGYFMRFDWAYDDDVNDHLAEIAVNPFCATYADQGSKVVIQPSPVMFAAQPFRFWRGEMIYRFEVVCTSFHRGKLAIIYEPNATNFVSNSAVTYFNKQHIQIIDIQETTEFEIRVQWCNQRQWCTAPSHTQPNHTPNGTARTVGTANNDNSNGMLYIVPFTHLQSPDESESAFVNVYVRCEDLQVNGPRSDSMPAERYIFTESDIVTESGKVNALPVTSFVINPTSANTDSLCVEFFGEQPTSFRQLLKRYQQEGSTVISSKTAGGSILTLAGPNMILYGNDFGVTSTVVNHFNYLRLGYLGVKGSVRRKVYIPWFVTRPNQQWRVSLRNPQSSMVTAMTHTYSTDTSNVPCSQVGTLIFTPHSNTGIEFEVPFYSANLFHFAFTTMANAVADPAFYTNWYQHYHIRTDVSDAQEASTWISDIAIGEDFSLYRFQGAPYFSNNIV